MAREGYEKDSALRAVDIEPALAKSHTMPFWAISEGGRSCWGALQNTNIILTILSLGCPQSWRRLSI